MRLNEMTPTCVKEIMIRSLRALLLPIVALLLSSCYGPGMVYPSGGYATTGYTSGYSVYDDYGGYAPIGYNRPFFGGFGGGYGYRGYGHYRNCSRCGHNPCSCSGGHNHGHSSHSNRSSGSSSSSDRKYRIIAGDLDGKKKPNDFHSLDWYHDRGYSLENAKIETNRGAVIDKRPSSQRRSSSASRSSSSNNRSSASSSNSNRGRSSSSSGNIRDQIKAGLSKKK